MVPCRSIGIFLSVIFLAVTTSGLAYAAPQAGGHTLVIDELGKGLAPLDGPWQLHIGDDPAWADPAFDDQGWEQVTVDKPWSRQGHPTYTGYAWYRRTLSVTPATGASPDFHLLIRGVQDVYQIYWNGVEVGHLGRMPPRLQAITGGPAQIYDLGPARKGVLAVRVWSLPQPSNSTGDFGGFSAVPQIGSPEAITAARTSLDYRLLRRQQFTFALTLLYTLVALLSLIAWLRDRDQWLLFWMAVFAFTPLIEFFLRNLQIPFSGLWLNFAVQKRSSVGIGQSAANRAHTANRAVWKSRAHTTRRCTGEIRMPRNRSLVIQLLTSTRSCSSRLNYLLSLALTYMYMHTL